MAKPGRAPTFAADPEAALAAYRETGFHVEPDLFGPDERRALIAAGKGLPSFADGSLTPFMQAHRADPLFLKALAHPKVVAVVERLVGGKVSGLQTEFFYCRPGVHGFSAHQDNAFVQAKPDAFASAWCALEEAAPENGGLIVYPGSHREAILPTRPLEGVQATKGQDPNAAKMEVVLPAAYKAVSLTVPAGAAVFIHSQLVHASNANKTKDKFRHVLLCTYIRRGEPFRAGAYAQRAEVDVYSARAS